MNKRKGLAMAVLLGAFLVFLAADFVHAGTSGKITGKVKDQKGASLPGVSVVIEGTRRGAVTDAQGDYTILSVDPGEYRVSASIIGYDKQTKTGVVVQADHTTEMNFSLRETAVEMQEMIVTAERPPVEMDRTESRYVITARDIEAVPMVRELNQIISLQPGMSVDESNNIRGGNQAGYSKDVTYYVDGVRMVHTDGGSSNESGLFKAVNASAIQEIQVIVGGMNAEYGNVQGGVINIITREGARKFGGRVEYKFTPAGKKHWGPYIYDERLFATVDPTGKVTYRVRYNEPEWAGELYVLPGPDGKFGTADDERNLAHEVIDYRKTRGHRAELMLNGPLGNRASYVLTTETSREASPLPGPEKYGYYNPEGASIGQPGDVGGFLWSPFNLRTTGKITVNVSPRITLKVNAVLFRAKDYGRTPTTGGTDQLMRGVQQGGQVFFLPGRSSRGKQKARDDLYSIQLTHSLSPRTLYELRIARFYTTRDTTSVPPATTPNIFDKDKAWTIDKSDHVYNLAKRDRLQLRFDLSSQVTKGHFIKTGFELTRYNTWNYNFSGTNNRNDSPSKSFGTVNGAGLAMGRGGKSFKPMQFAAYVQDKMEFRGMIVNLGVRLDALWPDTYFAVLPGAHVSPMFDRYTRYYALKDPSRPVDDPANRYLPLKKAPSIVNFSPRLGVSHPITTSSLVRFSFGQFYQVPNFTRAYGSSWSETTGDRDVNGNKVIDDTEWMNGAAAAGGDQGWGNWLRPKSEKTYNMEVGVDWNFVSDYTVALTTYYKSASDQQIRYVPQDVFFDPAGNRNISYGLGAPDGFEDSRGVELSFRKSFSHYFAFGASYNTGWLTGSGTGRSARTIVPDSSFVAAGGYWTAWKAAPDGSGREVPVPLTTAEIQRFGNNANEQIRRLQRQAGWAWKENTPLPGIYEFRRTIGGGGVSTGMFNVAGYPGITEADRRHQGSFTFTFSTPRDFGPSIRGFHLLGDFRANLVYRLIGGILYTYTPPGATAAEKRRTSTITLSDLSFNKMFGRPGKVRTEFFLDFKNAFNEANFQLTTSAASPPPAEWELYGIPFTTTPDSPYYVKFGDLGQRTRFFGKPRYWEAGLRLYW